MERKIQKVGKFWWYDGLPFTYENKELIQHAGVPDEKRLEIVKKLINEQEIKD